MIDKDASGSLMKNFRTTAEEKHDAAGEGIEHKDQPKVRGDTRGRDGSISIGIASTMTTNSCISNLGAFLSKHSARINSPARGPDASRFESRTNGLSSWAWWVTVLTHSRIIDSAAV
jgi:hypothetical protein